MRYVYIIKLMQHLWDDIFIVATNFEEIYGGFHLARAGSKSVQYLRFPVLYILEEGKSSNIRTVVSATIPRIGQPKLSKVNALHNWNVITLKSV